MSFSFSSRCGACIPNYGPDLCNIPTPSKYSSCKYTILSSLQVSDPLNNPPCDPGYTDFCKNTNSTGANTVMCCPNTANQNNFIKFDCNDSTCDISISFQNRRMECSSTNSLVDCLNNPDITSINGTIDDFPIPWLIPPDDIYKGFRTITTPCGGLDDYSCLPYSDLFQTTDNNATGGLCPSGQQTDFYYIENSSCSDLKTNPLCTTLTWTATTNKNGSVGGDHTYGVSDHTNLVYNPPLACPVGKERRTDCDTTTTFQPPSSRFFGITINWNPIQAVNSILCCDPSINNTTNNCTSMANFTTNSPEKEVYCQLVCPSLVDQKKVFTNQSTGIVDMSNVCDYSYFDLCKQSGCPIDPACKDIGIPAKKWLPVPIPGLLLPEQRPNRLPTVINKSIAHTHAPTSAPTYAPINH